MKTLVIYFSHTGHTQKIAEEIAANFESDMEQIKEVGERIGASGYLAAGRDAMLKRPGSIQPTHKDPAQYDLVFLGTPIWAWSVSPPMRAFITANRSKINQVAFFCTEGGSGGERAFRQMAELMGKQPVATLEVTEPDLKSGLDKEKLSTFYHNVTHRKSSDRGQTTVFWKTVVCPRLH
jgi:flavodoxin